MIISIFKISWQKPSWRHAYNIHTSLNLQNTISLEKLMRFKWYLVIETKRKRDFKHEQCVIETSVQNKLMKLNRISTTISVKVSFTNEHMEFLNSWFHSLNGTKTRLSGTRLVLKKTRSCSAPYYSDFWTVLSAFVQQSCSYLYLSLSLSLTHTHTHTHTHIHTRMRTHAHLEGMMEQDWQ